MTSLARFATPIDAHLYGEYRPSRNSVAFAAGRIGAAAWPADPGRYHVYGAATSATTHRIAILRELHELTDVVTMSYVDSLRDGRGWAFRESTGADPLNGFTLLREAFEATAPGFAGDVTVPVLWDRDRDQIVSTVGIEIGTDLATSFPSRAETYPCEMADGIEQFSKWLQLEFNPARALYDIDEAERTRRVLKEVDRTLGEQRYILGGRFTDADIRLWVELVRFDAGPNAHGALGPRLDDYRDLWTWAQRLYDVAAFQRTTDFRAFAAPYADLAPWGPRG